MGGWLMHYKIFRSIPDLYPLDTNRNPSCDNQTIPSNIAKCPLEEKNYPWLRITSLNELFFFVNSDGNTHTTS